MIEGSKEGELVLARIVGEALGSVLEMDVRASDGALLGRIVGRVLKSVLGMNEGASV